MSRWYDFGAQPSLTVAQRRAMAEREIESLRRQGVPIFPVTVAGRTIARSFWGRSWCENLESYRDYDTRLPRGRSYVRNSAVIDLQVSDLKVRAQVCGTSVYQVAVTIDRLPDSRWRSIRRDCAGGIDSLVELLQGRFSEAVMERLCRQGTGLFPSPSEIRFDCSCPDWASMCKHVAATLYGIGARLDAQPDLLFRLRGVDGDQLIGGLDRDLPLTARQVGRDRALDPDDLSALFGLEMETPDGTEPLPPDDVVPGDTEPAPDKPAKKRAIGRARIKPATARQPEKRPKAKKKPAKRKAEATAGRSTGREKSGAAKLELTPDGYVKWWK